MAEDNGNLEDLIAQWRNYRSHRQPPPHPEPATLESRLRDEAASLLQAGLTADEAFMVAVSRIANSDAASRDFGREHWERLRTLPAKPIPGTAPNQRTDIAVAFLLAVTAALAIKLPELFGHSLSDGPDRVYLLNLSLFALPLLAAYFLWKRRRAPMYWIGLALPFLAAAVIVNVYPFSDSSVATAPLAGLHLPIALWLPVGIAYTGSIAYTGGRWTFGNGQWMDFIRFTGEFAIYYILIALGGGGLTGLALALFDAIGVDVSGFLLEWVLPCGAMGAIPVCAWLVDGRRGVIENIAPTLARVFTPLVAALLLAFLATMLVTGQGIDAERQVLIAFDLLLALVLGLLLYSLSARSSQTPPSAFDWLTAALVVCALAADAVALAAIAARITEFGFSANKLAALGENLILLVNLAWSAWLYVSFLRRRGNFKALERWQIAYLPVYAVWAGVVVVVFPPVFGYA